MSKRPKQKQLTIEDSFGKSQSKTIDDFKKHINGIWKKMRTGIQVAQIPADRRAEVLQKLFYKIMVPGINEYRRAPSSMDMYPQTLTITVKQATANTFTIVEVPLAINRLSVNEGMAWVIEICRVNWTSGIGMYNLTTAVTQSIVASLSTQEQSVTTDLTDANVFWFARAGVNHREISAVGIAAVSFPRETQSDDLTSEGKGFLIGADQIYATFDTTGMASANTLVLKVFYRFREVGLAEYIGIVQGEED